MADAALENATARRDWLMDRLSRIGSEMADLAVERDKVWNELADVELFIKMWHQMAGTQPPEDLEQRKPAAPEPAPRKRPNNPDREDVAKACVEYIRSEGRPLSRRILFQMLTTNGIEIKGKNPEMVLSTMLWRSKDIIRRLRGGGYWPVGDPLPPGFVRDLEDIMT